MATNNAVNNGLSGTTGTGNFVGTTSPTLITPTLGAATATSLAFSPTTSGIIGTTTANNASAGYVGEEISSVIAGGSAVSWVNASYANLTSITLTAGDWDVFANAQSVSGSTFSSLLLWTSTLSANLPDSALYIPFYGLSTAGTIGTIAPYQRYNVSSNTIVYLSAQLTGTGSLSLCGGIYAVRVR